MLGVLPVSLVVYFSVHICVRCLAGSVRLSFICRSAIVGWMDGWEGRTDGCLVGGLVGLFIEFARRAINLVVFACCFYQVSDSLLLQFRFGTLGSLASICLPGLALPFPSQHSLGP